MFRALGRLNTRRPWFVIFSWLLLVTASVVTSMFGLGHGGLFQRMETGEYKIPGTDSAKVAEMTSGSSESGHSSILVVGEVASADARTQQFADGNRHLLETDHVTSVIDPFAVAKLRQDAEDQAAAMTQAGTKNQTPSASASAEFTAKMDALRAQEASLTASGGQGFAIIVTRDKLDDNAQNKSARASLDQGIAAYQDALSAEFPGATVHEMSTESVSSAINAQIEQDLVRGEAFGLPVAALLMLIVFGGAIAAGLPLVGAISAIAAGMGVLWVSTWVTSIDAFILNVVSIIGLSLSIDYGLLVVSRFREEGAARLERMPDELVPNNRREMRRRIVAPAVRETVASAGRTVVFSAVTIAFSLAGIFLIKIHTLQTIAWGGIIVALLAVLAAVTLVPAMLTLLGDRLLKPSPLTKVPLLGRMMKAVGDSSSDHGIFSKLAHWVQRRPWTVMIAVIAILLVMASPVREMQLRNNFTDYIPKGSNVETAYRAIQDQYPHLATPAIRAVADAPQDSPDVSEYVDQIRALPGVTDVVTSELQSNGNMTVIDVRVDAGDQVGSEVTQLVKDMRALPDTGTQVWVGGSAANQLDFRSAVTKDMPAALLFVAIAVMLLLFLMTGSVIVPIKALLINSLSIIASLGVTVAVFKNGWLGVPQTPGLETFIVVCMIAFGFGLSMDYEVFLLARIKEYWDAGDSNDVAVAKGLQRSGRIITSAAAIVIAVFIGFAMGQMIAIKQIGVGLAIMVATDATLTRMLLVPSTMTVLGKWNWWAPKPLAKIAEKIGLRE